MTSQEIADLVESRHDNVKRTVERLSERGTIQLPPTEEVKNHQGQAVSVYQLCKRDSYVVVARLDLLLTCLDLGKSTRCRTGLRPDPAQNPWSARSVDTELDTSALDTTASADSFHGYSLGNRSLGNGVQPCNLACNHGWLCPGIPC